jgi:tetratricopeptide (TPR) repeat protein
VTGSYDPPPEFGLGRDEQYARARQLAEAAEGRTLKASEVSSHWTRRGLEAWASSPGAMLVVIGRKLANFWKGFELHDAVDYYESLPQSAVLSLPLPSFRVVGPLALVGLVVVWFIRRRDGLGIALLYGLLGAHLAFLLVFFVTSRFRVSITPALFPFAAATIVWLVERAVARRFVSLAAGLVALALAAAFVNVDPSFVDAAGLEATAHANRGQMLLREKRYAEAERELREAIRLRPHFAGPKWSLSQVLVAMNRADDALHVVEEAAADDPTNAAGLSYLGNLYLDHKMPERAIPVLEAGRRIDPRNETIVFNLAVAYRETGRTKDAIETYRAAAELGGGLAARARKCIADLGGE